MIFQSGKMRLQDIRTVKTGSVNDIYICRDLNTLGGNYYTLLVVKDHAAAKTYIEILDGQEGEYESSCIEYFSSDGFFCIVFPYKKERPLSAFYMGKAFSLAECEEICMNLILACITEKLPFPVLYLMLKQGQIHLSKGRDIYFSYQIDLEELDQSVTERDCVMVCGEILQRLLEPKAKQKAVSYLLLRKKCSKRSYAQFTELYRDIRASSVSGTKKGIRERLNAFYRDHQDRIFRILLRVCIVLAAVAAVSLISQMAFGEVLWLRFFSNGFRIIGTENLVAGMPSG